MAARGEEAELGRVRQMTAAIEIRRGRYAVAEALLDQAEAVWRRQPDRFLRERAELSGFRAALLRERGDRAAGLEGIRVALEGVTAALGAASIDAVALRRNLGIHLLELGDLAGAKAAFEAARSALAATGRSRAPAAIATSADLAQVAFLEGDTATARALWETAIADRRSGYGRSEALAAIEIGYARALLAMGEPETALPLLDEAFAISSTGQGGVVRNVILQSRGLAHLMLGRLDLGRRDVEAAVAHAADRFGTDSIYYGMALMARADLNLLSADPAAAAADAKSAAAVFDAIGAVARPQRDALRRIEDAIGQARRSAPASP